MVHAETQTCKNRTGICEMAIQGAANSSLEGAKKVHMEIEEIARVVVNCGYGLHKELGPGLLESVYEVVLAKLLVEIKSVENLAPVHGKQLLTYLRLLNLPLGLLMNFGAAIFKNGIKRIVNNHSDFAASRLRVHQGLLEDVHT